MLPASAGPMGVSTNHSRMHAAASEAYPFRAEAFRAFWSPAARKRLFSVAAEGIASFVFRWIPMSKFSIVTF